MGEREQEAMFTERELDVMSVLWRLGSGTVAEVREALRGDPAYTTVLTMLRILEEKGHVRHEQEGRAHRYHPVVRADEAGGHALRRIVDKIYHGSMELLVTRLVDDASMSPDEIRRLRRALDEAEADARASEGEEDA